MGHQKKSAKIFVVWIDSCVGDELCAWKVLDQYLVLEECVMQQQLLRTIVESIEENRQYFLKDEDDSSTLQ